MKRNRITTIILIITFIVGLCLLMYPKVSNYWNSFHQTKAISQYVSNLEGIDEAEYDRMLSAAREYNLSLPNKRINKYELTDEQEKEYQKLLKVTETGIMGYVEIPIIGISLPIYHGSSETALQSGIGHLEWTSLPVGGESTHCVLTGHRGLPSSRLLTDLDKLVEGDKFILKVLNETLTYEVDQILIVEPKETEHLRIVKGEDYCTLVTCTPYGVNTHRILVRGHRVENELQSSAHVTSDAIAIEPMLVALVMFGVLLIIIFIIAMTAPDKERKKIKKQLTQREVERNEA